jgi:hypothetical protein
VPKENFIDFLHHVDERRFAEMNEEINRAAKRSIEGYSRANLRTENKADWKTVEQIESPRLLRTDIRPLPQAMEEGASIIT